MEATLMGFSSFLDWRPLTFLNPLPRSWTCNICGLMSQALMVTECFHVFCSNCYQRLLDKESLKCPLDKVDVKADKTKKFVFGDDHKKLLLVRCLNAEHGCKFEGPLEDLETHYTKDCNFHVVTCKSCGSTSLCTELLQHLEKDCKTQLEDVTPDLIQKPVPGQLSDPKSDCGCKSKEMTANLVNITVEDNPNILIESMKQCTADLAKNLMEATQHCMKAADDSKNVTSSLAQPMQQYIRDVEELKKTLTSMTEAFLGASKQRDAALCESCGKIPKSWLALGFFPNGVGALKYVFTCTKFSAKVAAAPAMGQPPHVYLTQCPKGNALFRGSEVQLCLRVHRDYSKNITISFGLTILEQSINCGSVQDFTLFLVHPTDASLNKCRPLRSEEIFKSQSVVKEFSFYPDDLRKRGFVADDMLLVCLEVA